MNKIPASAYIISKNEAHNIRRALESLCDFAEIVVLDSGSTDETLKIAREFTQHVYHQDWKGYAKQKEHGLSLCNEKWVLNIDADEELTPELGEEIREFIKSEHSDALNIPVKDIFLGKLPTAGVKLNRKVRFYRKAAAYFPEKLVHESVVIKGKVLDSKHSIIHHGESSIKVKVEKNNLYSSLRANEKIIKGKKPSLLKLLFIFPLALFKSYILRRSCLNGWRGLVNSMINAFYAFLKESKMFEQYYVKNHD